MCPIINTSVHFLLTYHLKYIPTFYIQWHYYSAFFSCWTTSVREKRHQTSGQRGSSSASVTEWTVSDLLAHTLAKMKSYI